MTTTADCWDQRSLESGNEGMESESTAELSDRSYRRRGGAEEIDGEAGIVLGFVGGDGGDHRSIVGAGDGDGGCIGGGGGAVSDVVGVRDDDGFTDGEVIEFVGINGQVLA